MDSVAGRLLMGHDGADDYRDLKIGLANDAYKTFAVAISSRKYIGESGRTLEQFRPRLIRTSKQSGFQEMRPNFGRNCDRSKIPIADGYD